VSVLTTIHTNTKDSIQAIGANNAKSVVVKQLEVRIVNQKRVGNTVTFDIEWLGAGT
jgi:hypothetical protein